MAKFANVTYGTGGDTKEYTYVVNDNVRTGDYIQPSVKHYKSGTVFGTTAIVQSTAKETSAKGQELKSELNEKDIHPAETVTGKQLGLTPGRSTETGKFNAPSGLKKTIKNPETGMRQAPEGAKFQANQYIEQTRKANVELRDSVESFDSYSQKYMPKKGGEQ